MVRVVGSPCGPSGGRYGPWTETSQFSDGSRTARSHHYVNGPSRPDHPVGDPQIRTARKFKSFRAVHGRSGRPCAWLTIRMPDGQPGIRKSRIPRLMVRKVVRSAGPLILTTHTPSGELGSTSNDTSTRHSVGLSKILSKRTRRFSSPSTYFYKRETYFPCAPLKMLSHYVFSRL
jgi:hypothetical protein